MNLKELARNLGLSQTTISRALNGYPEVNADTRARVKEAAARLGYRPNASARQLATGRVGAIGIVYSTEYGFGPHTGEFLGGLGARLAKDDVDVLVSTCETTEDEMSIYRRAAASKKVDAFIVHSPMPHDRRVKLLHELRLPFVLHGRTESLRAAAWLDIDNASVTETATNHLLDLGHREIGLINGPRELTFSTHRVVGYRNALAMRGIRMNPDLIAYGAFTDEVGFRLAQAMLKRSPRPTAILAGSMMTALGVFRAVRARGLTLGRDVSMVAHDDVFPYLNADTMVPKMSTTRSPIRAAGARIGELVLQMLAGKAPETIHELWPVELILRESTGPAPVEA
jgi:LacI family transcriptional regulator